MNRKVSIAVVCISLLLLGIAGYVGYEYYKDYKLYQNQQEERGALAKFVTNDDAMERRIDFQGLQKINPHITRWVYVPNTAIDDPVVQEQSVGVYKYSFNNIYGRWNGAGTFLVPARNRDGNGNMVDEDHLMILGHRLNSNHGEWQFSELPVRWGDERGALAYPYIYIYYEEKVEKYRVYTAGQSYASSDAEYQTPYMLKTLRYQDMLDSVVAKARYVIEPRATMYDKTLMLSTCNGDLRSDGTFHLHAVLEDVVYY